MIEPVEVPQKTYYFFEYWEVDQIVEGFYGADPGRFTIAMERSNDTLWRHYWEGNSPKAWGNDDAADNITAWFEGTYQSHWDLPDADDFMKELAYLGFIPAGTYLIQVSW